jgi:hypothetical protein
MADEKIFVEDENAAAREAITRIEAKMGAPLPDEYRDYLLAGLPWNDERNILRFGPGDDWPDRVEVDCPYHYRVTRTTQSARGVVKNVTIESLLELYDGRNVKSVPRDAMAVADLPMYGEVILFLRGTRRGQVWLKDWEDDTNDPEAGLRFAASNFKEFLEKLQSEDEPPIRR